MFVNYLYHDAGSVMDIYSYSKAAKKLGHEIIIYGQPKKNIPLQYSLNLNDADFVIFILEWTTFSNEGDQLDLIRILDKIPRDRRIVIDCDGNYNDRVQIGKDYNHKSTKSSQLWMEIVESISDKIFQPSLQPLKENVQTFFFHAYDSDWEKPLNFSKKDFDMIYVGHNKFRWFPMKHIIDAVKPIRKELGRIGIFGHGWDKQPAWSKELDILDNYHSKPSLLKKLDFQILKPVPFTKLLDTMSRATLNPIIFRSIFTHFQLTTPRMYETFAANTIPVLSMNNDLARLHFGDSAEKLVLNGSNPDDQILDFIKRPDYYANFVSDVRSHLNKYHSHALRLNELIDLVAS